MIKDLHKYTKEPNTLSCGTLYVGTVNIKGLPEDETRNVRIYLPSTYENKKLPVIYMMDGKNLFDKHTSFMGEWEFDETIEKRIKEGKLEYIVVGIDSATSGEKRVEEMLPNNKHLTNVDDMPKDLLAYGNILGDFIVKELKNDIDNLFNTNKEYSIIGGSSMGGLFAFYMANKYPNIFKGSLCFSPAFCLYEEIYFIKQLKKLKLNNNSMYLLVGELEYENQFVKLTEYVYDYMVSVGFANIKFIHDLSGIHHESFWTKYIDDALTFIENEK